MSEPASIWEANPEIVAALTELWPVNSATQCANKIAEQFGVILTKSAVIGKAHRLGLNGTTKSAVPNRVVNVAPRPAPVIECVTADVPSLDLTLDDLTLDNCRFIAGEAKDARYCGHQVHRRGFCEPHFRLCYLEPIR